jgi:hypothetical protein
MAHKGPFCENKIGAGIVKSLIDKEIFLFYPESCKDLGYILVKKLADIYRSFVEC